VNQIWAQAILANLTTTVIENKLNRSIKKLK